MDATASEPANVAGAAQPTNTDAQPAAAAPTAANETIAKDTTGAVAPADASKTAAANKFDIPADAGPAALRDAAAGGDAKALFEIGSRYAESRGVKEDMIYASLKPIAQWHSHYTLPAYLIFAAMRWSRLSAASTRNACATGVP